MKIYLARHGRTNYNDLELCNYTVAVDVHLTSLGIDQANGLAQKLRTVQLDHIFVSELKRTQQTAKIINEFHDAHIDIDARLNDIASGFEGKPFKDYVAALDAEPNKWTAHFNGGESVEDMKQRVADFIDELRTKDYDAVLIITSQWVIYAIMALVKDLANEEAWDFGLEQGDFVVFEIAVQN